MRKGALALMIVTGLVVSGCSQKQTTAKGELTSRDIRNEVYTDEQQYSALQQASGGLYVADSSVVAYVQQVGAKLAAVSDHPDLPFEFVVVNHPVPNAWALSNGKIAIHRGLLTELDNESELAAVLANEIVHVSAQLNAPEVDSATLHQAGLTSLNTTTAAMPHGGLVLFGDPSTAHLVAQKHSRNTELEADARVMDLLTRAGYSPKGVVTLQAKFIGFAKAHNPSWFAGLFHGCPPNLERLEQSQRLLHKHPDSGVIGQDEYQEATASLLASKEAYYAYDQGRAALANKSTSSASQCAQFAVNQYEPEALFYGLLGDVYQTQGDYKNAVANYDQAMKRNPRYFYYPLQRGLSYQKANMLGSARRDLVASLKLLPTVAAHTELGKIELANNNQPVAVKHLRTASEADPINNREQLTLLVRQEMRSAPDHYFNITSNVDADGYVRLVVENRSVMDAAGVIVSLNLQDDLGSVKATRNLRVPQRLPAGYKATLRTDLSMDHYTDSTVVAKVVRAFPAG